MGFFDDERHSVGALSARLATDAYQMHELFSQPIRTLCSTLSIVIISMVFAFKASWMLTLIILVLIPLMGVAQYYEVAALTGFGQKTQKAYEQSGKVAAEAIAHVRTVAALTKEQMFEDKYDGKGLVEHWLNGDAYMSSRRREEILTTQSPAPIVHVYRCHKATTQVHPSQGLLCIVWLCHVTGYRVLGVRYWILCSLPSRKSGQDAMGCHVRSHVLCHLYGHGSRSNGRSNVRKTRTVFEGSIVASHSLFRLC
jgi:ABC-type multidrug transport system fused ATPase/permease subunit